MKLKRGYVCKPANAYKKIEKYEFSVEEKEVILPSGEKVIFPVKIFSTLDPIGRINEAQPKDIWGVGKGHVR